MCLQIAWSKMMSPTLFHTKWSERYFWICFSWDWFKIHIPFTSKLSNLAQMYILIYYSTHIAQFMKIKTDYESNLIHIGTLKINISTSTPTIFFVFSILIGYFRGSDLYDMHIMDHLMIHPIPLFLGSFVGWRFKIRYQWFLLNVVIFFILNFPLWEMIICWKLHRCYYALTYLNEIVCVCNNSFGRYGM